MWRGRRTPPPSSASSPPRLSPGPKTATATRCCTTRPPSTPPLSPGACCAPGPTCTPSTGGVYMAFPTHTSLLPARASLPSGSVQGSPRSPLPAHCIHRTEMVWTHKISRPHEKTPQYWLLWRQPTPPAADTSSLWSRGPCPWRPSSTSRCPRPSKGRWASRCRSEPFLPRHAEPYHGHYPCTHPPAGGLMKPLLSHPLPLPSPGVHPTRPANPDSRGA